jgi:hypothetical protein
MRKETNMEINRQGGFRRVRLSKQNAIDVDHG